MPTDELDPDALVQMRFKRSLRGYAPAEVDQLLKQLAQDLTRQREGHNPALTPKDLRHAEFTASLRGYNPRQVDELLDRLAVQLWGPGSDRPKSRRPTPADGLDPDAVVQMEFKRSLRGYMATEVDVLLDKVAEELTRRREGHDPVLTAMDVRHTMFTVSMPGYDRGQVDQFLERLAAQLEEQED